MPRMKGALILNGDCGYHTMLGSDPGAYLTHEWSCIYKVEVNALLAAALSWGISDAWRRKPQRDLLGDLPFTSGAVSKAFCPTVSVNLEHAGARALTGSAFVRKA